MSPAVLSTCSGQRVVLHAVGVRTAEVSTNDKPAAAVPTPHHDGRALGAWLYELDAVMI